ncbi:MCM5-like protein [Mya arenaria]|uniref:DNA replication licensing factor MCM5 n=1 Tax=Mya arenaria TaxID=6604 RepID=A0ABY7F8M3_MYAAR|nr:MCM5-like protein [Mya arenaria]WAR18340.1 MCM5-like protein [Mya arenaria]
MDTGFDDPGIFFSDNFGSEDQNNDDQINRVQVKKRFKDFIRQFHEGQDELKRHYNLGEYYLEVEIEDVSSFDEALAEKLYKLPAQHLPLFEDAAKEVADEITKPRPDGDEEVQDIQVMLTSKENATNLRGLKSDQMSKLLKIPGIVIAASAIKSKATTLTLQCRSCRNVINNIAINPGLEGYSLPRKCNTYMCDKAVPGNRVSVIGIFSIKKMAPTKGSAREKVNVGIRAPYFRVVGIQVDTEGKGHATGTTITPTEEEDFQRLAKTPNVYDTIAKSIAPSIYGSLDMKRAIACLLFGGSRKRLPDGLTRRGDVNLLMLGDPGTAKSQLLKFVERVSPIAVYTSGKGSSAAGLTASVNRDPQTRNFVMEGGAMVLADGGVVCIDEFDKMREDDRVAIHEAMEQQTISIAKAGITTTLNSRCSVLAAANSVYGRWDDTKGEENIDFMPTILSRFDMIFIVKDMHDEARDTRLAKHVMNVHLNALQMTEEQAEGEIDLLTLKKYINYCRGKCGPRLSSEAAEKLKNRYVLMRNSAGEYERETGKKVSIPITVRQLEAIIRISESLAKMKLQPFATESEVDEALRLFQVSTLDAAMTGNLAEEDQDMLSRIEKQLKRRFVIGSQVSEHAVLQDFSKQKYPERSIQKVIHFMLRRGELQHRMQRKMLYRVK